jgi:hypothetical protein
MQLFDLIDFVECSMEEFDIQFRLTNEIDASVDQVMCQSITTVHIINQYESLQRYIV